MVRCCRYRRIYQTDTRESYRSAGWIQDGAVRKCSSPAVRHLHIFGRWSRSQLKDDNAGGGPKVSPTTLMGE